MLIETEIRQCDPNSAKHLLNLNQMTYFRDINRTEALRVAQHPPGRGGGCLWGAGSVCSVAFLWGVRGDLREDPPPAGDPAAARRTARGCGMLSSARVNSNASSGTSPVEAGSAASWFYMRRQSLAYLVNTRTSHSSVVH